MFIPPTVDEVREYCSERKNNVNPEEFVSFYASKGWMIGKNKMKSWKQAVVTWELRHKRDVPLEDSSDSSKVPPRQQDTPKSTPRVNPRNFLNFEQTYATEDFEQIERCCLDN